jgi:hypothetical protein
LDHLISAIFDKLLDQLIIVVLDQLIIVLLDQLISVIEAVLRYLRSADHRRFCLLTRCIYRIS